MLTQAEIARALEGAWLLARGDARGLDRFDFTVEGFWRSFGAALIVAPPYVLVLLERYSVLGWPANPLRAVLGELLGFACGWIVFPLAAILLTRLLDLTRRYVPLVVTTNWATVLQVGLYAAVATVGLLLPLAIRTLLLLAATVAALVYQWFVIRTSLQTTGATALGVVTIYVLLGAAISRAVDGLVQGG